MIVTHFTPAGSLCVLGLWAVCFWTGREAARTVCARLGWRRR